MKELWSSHLPPGWDTAPLETSPCLKFLHLLVLIYMGMDNDSEEQSVLFYSTTQGP